MTTRHHRHARSAAAAVTVVVLALPLIAAAAEQTGGLFSAVGTASASAGETVARSGAALPSTADAITLRRRTVQVDLGLLERAAASVARRAGPPAVLNLNLFNDVVLTGIVERTAPTFSGGYSISGRIAGEPLGTMTLVVNGETVVGTVHTLRGTYRIRWAGEGLYSVSEVDLSRLPEDAEPLPPDARAVRESR